MAQPSVGANQAPRNPSGCLSDETIVRLADGALSGLELDAALAHLDHCADCRALVVPPTGAASTLFAGSATAFLAPASRNRETPAEALSAGRYHPLSLLGRGGMGAVYRAYDPKLKREVAIKVVSTSHLEGSQRHEATERLLREAEALAQLSHPNVVTVFDVGAIGEDVFLAMELIRGRTLRAHLKDPVPLSKRLDLFLRAGRGLAAAHAAGIVHRDFKPDNVMVANDGAVKVVDFGLARVAPIKGPHRARTAEDSGLMGTPRYMAPEQVEQAPTDHRTDQYSFCVGLYEALYDRHPFEQRLASFPLHFPAKKGVSGRLKKALSRGLSEKREARFDSMNALLAEMSPPRRRAPLLGGVALIAAASVLTWSLSRPTPAALCESGAENFSGIWDPTMEARVRTAFASSGVPGAADLFARTSFGLDAFRQAWLAEHRATCRATHVLGQQSTEALDARMRCLTRQLGEVRAWLVTLQGATGRTELQRAVRVARDFTPPVACREAASTEIPADKRERANELEAQLARALAHERTGHYQQAAIAAEKTADASEDLLWLRPEALRLHGRNQYAAGDAQAAVETLYAAADAARAGQRPEILPDIWIDLIDALAARSRHREALTLERVVRNQLGSGPVGDRRQAALDMHVARVLGEMGQHDEARRRYQQAVQTLAKESPPPIALGWAHLAWGRLEQEAGRFDEALKQFDSSEKILRSIVGPEHPDPARALLAKGATWSRAGDPARALAALADAEALFRRTLAKDDPALAMVRAERGHLHLRADALASAEREFAAAQAVLEAAYPAGHPLVANLSRERGAIALRQGDHKRAVELLGRSADMATRTVGPKSHYLALTLSLLGVANAHLGRVIPAKRASLRALEIGHPDTGQHATMMFRRAQMHALLGEITEARGLGNRVLEVFPVAMKEERAEVREFLKQL